MSHLKKAYPPLSGTWVKESIELYLCSRLGLRILFGVNFTFLPY
jgi:hypothetical protein